MVCMHFSDFRYTESWNLHSTARHMRISTKNQTTWQNKLMSKNVIFYNSLLSLTFVSEKHSSTATDHKEVKKIET